MTAIILKYARGQRSWRPPAVRDLTLACGGRGTLKQRIDALKEPIGQAEWSAREISASERQVVNRGELFPKAVPFSSVRQDLPSERYRLA